MLRVRIDRRAALSPFLGRRRVPRFPRRGDRFLDDRLLVVIFDDRDPLLLPERFLRRDGGPERS